VSRRIATKGLSVEVIEPSWLNRMLDRDQPECRCDPDARRYLRAICLTLGLYALNLLPIDYTGLALMLLGLAFLVAEAFTPTFGVLGLGGLIAFVLGAAILIDVDVPGFKLTWTVIATTALMSLGLMTLLLGYVVRSRHSPLRVGTSTLLGQRVEVLDWSGKAGHVLAEGERWHAQGDDPLQPGDTAEIVGVDGLTLMVRKRTGLTAAGD
jgi:membrane-bound serine protease (ClpP class)